MLGKETGARCLRSSAAVRTTRIKRSARRIKTVITRGDTDRERFARQVGANPSVSVRLIKLRILLGDFARAARDPTRGTADNFPLLNN